MKSFRMILLILFALPLHSISGQTTIPKAVNELLVKHTCFTCHTTDKKLIGPSYNDIAALGLKKEDFIAAVYKPDAKRWPGYPPMMPMPHVPKADLEKIAAWIAKIKPKAK